MRNRKNNEQLTNESENNNSVLDEIENNNSVLDEIENNNSVLDEIENNENIKKLIADLNISVESSYDLLKNEFKKYQQEQSETVNQLNQKIDEVNKLLEPEWQTEQKTIEAKPEAINNYNAFWKGE